MEQTYITFKGSDIFDPEILDGVPEDDRRWYRRGAGEILFRVDER